MKKITASLAALMLASGCMWALPTIEKKLDRGVVAVTTTSGTFVSWRSLVTDNKAMTFDVYRDGTKVNAEPITAGTNLQDKEGKAGSKYVVKALVEGSVVETSPEATAEAAAYRRLHLDRPTGSGCTYTPNDMSVGDVDGDGKYELFVKWDPSNSHDNSQHGKTGNVYIDCYTLEGQKLWRVDLGQNIRAGAHYTQFMVADFDGDGKAEMIVKTAPGTIDGTGKAVLMGSDKVTDNYVNSKGHIISGPEYLTVFNGQTGAEVNTIAYQPARNTHPMDKSTDGWGDDYGGRSERYLAGVAYLGGPNPSAVMCRGYYTHSYLWAVDFDGSKLKQRWLHASTTKGKGAYGEGAHSLTIGDVDGDGYDEIVYGAASIDHDGSLLYRTGGGHGDALHLGDLDPDREGYEVFMVHEETGSAYKYDAEFRDAKTGEIIWSIKQSGNDIGRGLVADLSADWHGYECWPGAYYGSGSKGNATFDCKGNLLVTKRPSTNFRIYWDGDLLDEVFDGCFDSASGKSEPVIEKRSANLNSSSKLMSFGDGQTCNSTKGTPCLQADILGDWREEVILWDYNNPADIMIYTTTIPTAYRVPCLMQDHNYRLAIAWQNTAYNQPPHLGYYLYDTYNLDPKLVVTEGAMTQNIETGYPIQTIKGYWDRCDDIITANLPKGLTLNKDMEAKTFTISGTPEAVGTYKFKVGTVGGVGNMVMLTFNITVVETTELTRVAHFSFDQVGATVTNHVQGEATAHGTPSATEGKAAGAISFNGTTDYLTQATYDKLQMGSQSFTIEFLFNSMDDAAYMLHKGSTTANDAPGATGNWIGLEYKGGNLKFAVDDDAQKSEATAEGSSYFDGKWHHLVLVRDTDAKQLRIYVDATLVAESADGTGAVNDNNEDLVIANVNNKFNNFYEGLMDDFSIYTGAMTSNKVAERFQSYNESGIVEIPGASDAPKKLTLVDAATGMIVATGVGETENVTSQAAPGIYILVIEQGKTRYISKIRL